MAFDADAIRSTLRRVALRGRNRAAPAGADCPQCNVSMTPSGRGDRPFWVCPDCDGIALD
jgi:uncharacterized protein with PIN domain